MRNGVMVLNYKNLILKYLNVVVSCPGLPSPEQIFSSEAGAQAVGGEGGGRLRKGREDRKREVRPGLAHKSLGLRSVGWEGHEKRCLVVCGAERQDGQRLFGALPTLSR